MPLCATEVTLFSCVLLLGTSKSFIANIGVRMRAADASMRVLLTLPDATSAAIALLPM